MTSGAAHGFEPGLRFKEDLEDKIKDREGKEELLQRQLMLTFR